MSDQSAAVDKQEVIDGGQPATPIADSKQQQALAGFNKKNAGNAAMRVHIYSPFRDYYDGQAISLSAENATGPFDILAHHHNFISLLLPCDIVIRTVNEGERKVRIAGGIIHVKANQVIVFLDV